MSQDTVINRNLAMEAVRITEAAAVAASRFLGRGDERAVDRAAVDAMHSALGGLSIDGVVRIGEGEQERSPKLYVGEKAGTGGGPRVDLAVMPLESPTIIAKGEPNGMSVIAVAEDGGFADMPTAYMEKLAIGGGLPEGVVSLDEAPAKNLKELARAKGVEVGELVACILDRPRHTELIAKVREAGARIQLIADGDLSGVVSTVWPETGIDIYMGIGASRQGLLAAAALACAAGQMQTRMVVRGDEEKARVAARGIADPGHIYTVPEMVNGDITFAATGVTSGAMLGGVKRRHGAVTTHSLVMRSRTGTLHFIKAFHDFAQWSGSAPSGT